MWSDTVKYNKVNTIHPEVTMKITKEVRANKSTKEINWNHRHTHCQIMWKRLKKKKKEEKPNGTNNSKVLELRKPC